MSVKRGKVTETVIEKRLSIVVEGEQYFAPKECDPIIGPQLEAFAGQEVEVLMAKDTVLAIRPLKELLEKVIVITCYFCPLEVAFAPDIMKKIEPFITESLLESGYLGESVVERLSEWHKAPRVQAG
jgi:hypothetical protein